MAEPQYPNESAEYRQAREALLAEEQALMDKVKAVAALRRKLPLGGEVQQDYVFVSANNSTLGEDLHFTDLFAGKPSLLIYSYMFGPDWDNPCPSCTSLVDGFDRASVPVSHNAAFVVVAKAPAARLNAWANSRGWQHINLVSAEKTDFLKHYRGQGDDDNTLWPMMNVFTRRDEGIFHFWGSELPGNHVDLVWPYWNLMDMTPEGRPDFFTPPLGFRSEYLEKNYGGN